MTKITLYILPVILFLMPFAAFGQDAEKVELDPDHPIHVLINDFFQHLMDKNLTDFPQLYHPDSDAYPTDEILDEIEKVFWDLNLLVLVHRVLYVGQDDDVTMIEVEYVGVLYEEDNPPDFSVGEDDVLVMPFQVKEFEGEWKIWDEGFTTE